MQLIPVKEIRFLSALLFFVTFSSVLLPLKPTRNPVKAPQLFQYVPARANLIVQIDVKTMSNHVVQATKTVGGQPFVSQVKAMRDVHKLARRAILGNLKRWEKRLGFSLQKDLQFLTFSSQLARITKPRILVVFGGKFQAKHAQRMAKFFRVHKHEKKLKNGFTTYLSKLDRDPSVALTPEGRLLFGSVAAVRGIAKRGAKAAPAKGSLRARMIAGHKASHFLSVGLQPSKRHKGWLKRAKLPMFKDLALATTALHLALESKKAGLTAWVSEPKLRKRYHAFFQGLGALGVAGGYLKLAMLRFGEATFNPNNPHLPKRVKELAKHKKAIFAYLTKYLGTQPMRFATTMVNDKLQLQVQGGSSVALLFGIAGAYMLFPARAVMMAPYSAKPQQKAAPKAAPAPKPTKRRPAPGR